MHGTGEALLMAMAGRRGVVGELTTGHGQPVLASRTGTEEHDLERPGAPTGESRRLEGWDAEIRRLDTG